MSFLKRSDLLTFLYLFPVRAAAAILPITAVRALGGLFGHIYALPFVSGERRRSLEKNLSLAFKDSRTAEEIKRLSGACILNAISTYMDDLILNRIETGSLGKSGSIEGMENLVSAMSRRRGVIVVSGHFSANRVAKRFLREKGYPMLSVRARYPSDLSRLLLRWYRMLDEVVEDQVFAEDKGVGLEILRRLRENGLVSTLFDSVKSSHVIECPFLGGTRWFSADFLRIARLTRSPVVPMLCTGNSTGFTIRFEKEVELEDHDDMAEFLSINLRKVVEILESHVLENPTHWLFI